MPLRALRRTRSAMTKQSNHLCGERHHALAGIATLLLISLHLWRSSCGERHHALAGIATNNRVRCAGTRVHGGERHHALAGIATSTIATERAVLSCGERHHALAGIATTSCDINMTTLLCGERHHALAGIATLKHDYTPFIVIWWASVEKDIMPLRALRLWSNHTLPSYHG